MDGKKIRNLVLSGLLFSFSYVLPYPGLMPGHRLYPIKQIFDQIYQLLVFGNFSRHKYELALADKKLVEAKILFEYQQYPLAIEALEASNIHFKKAASYLIKAEEEGKNISAKTANLKSAAEKHREVLEKLQNALPIEFVWRPEKKEPNRLLLGQALEKAIEIRRFK